MTQFLNRPVVRYLIAVFAAGAGWLVRLPLAETLGSGLTYITFYPAVMLTATLAGFGPGLLATGLSALVVAVWILPPVGQFRIDNTADAIGLAVFVCMGIFMSAIAGLYRRASAKAAALEKQQAAPTPTDPTTVATLEPFRDTKRRLVFDAALLMVLAILASVAYLSYRDLAATIAADQRENHTYQVIDEFGNLLSSLKDAETGQRGYIITGDESFLEPYRASLKEIEAHLAAVRQLTADNPLQQQRLAAIAPVIAARLEGLKATIALRQTKDLASANAIVASGRGEQLMDELRGRITAAQQTEKQLLATRTARKVSDTSQTIQSVRFGDALGGLTLLVLFLVLKRELARRRRVEAALRAHEAHLADLVDERTRDLRAEQAALSESQQRYASLFEGSLDAIFSLGTDGHLVTANPAALRLMGRSLAEAQQIHFLELCAPDQRAAAANAFRAAFCRQCLTLETAVIAADGSRRELFISGAPAIVNDQVVGVSCIARDITARQQAEAAVQESEARFGGIVSSAMDAIVSVDSDQRIVLFNASAERMFGYRAHEVVGQSLGLLLPADRRTMHEQHVRNFAATGVTARQMGALGELVGLRANGEQFPIEASISQIEIAGRKVLTVILRDITARQQAEAEIRQLNESLEERVRTRTAELTAANADLEAFSYSVSHDLRAPLRTIDGFSQAVLEDYPDKLDATGQDFLQRIRAGCQAMGALIDDLLNLSRLSRAPMHQERVDLTALAQRIGGELQQQAPTRVVEFRIDNGLTAVGDPHLLTVVLQNLLENAWKFTGKQERAVIEFGETTDDHSPSGAPQSPVFFIRDNGSGFDMAYADKLFTPFQRLHQKEEFPGTGIGLATIQRIIRRHNGRIWVVAALNKGATFYFIINQERSGHGR